MQTFLPFQNFHETAHCLDRQRLGKQRVENLQIARALNDPSYGWQNHPAVKMWRGHEYSLFRYQLNICNEWTSRGYKDTCLNKTVKVFENSDGIVGSSYPYWLGDDEFHLSHRSNLLRKDFEHYSKYFNHNNVPINMPYIWPEEKEMIPT